LFCFLFALLLTGWSTAHMNVLEFFQGGAARYTRRPFIHQIERVDLRLDGSSRHTKPTRFGGRELGETTRASRRPERSKQWNTFHNKGQKLPYFSDAVGPAEILPPTAFKYSFTALEKLSNQYANLFLEEDLRPGQTVVIFMENSITMVASFLGVLKAGATPTLLNPSARNIAVVLKDLVQTNVRARMVLYDKTTQEFARESQTQVVFNDQILAHDGSSGSGVNRWLCCNSAAAANHSDRRVVADNLFKGGIPRADPSAICCRSYSGDYSDISQGKLQAQLLTHASFVQYGVMLARSMGLNEHDCIYGAGLPLYEIRGGIGMLAACIASGSSYCIADTFAHTSRVTGCDEPGVVGYACDRYWQECRRQRCSCVLFTQAQAERLLGAVQGSGTGTASDDLRHPVKMALGIGELKAMPGQALAVDAQLQERFAIECMMSMEIPIGNAVSAGLGLMAGAGEDEETGEAMSEEGNVVLLPERMGMRFSKVDMHGNQATTGWESGHRNASQAKSSRRGRPFQLGR
jgi:acyl-CoA synthetase (AMP-forming)/AMP-acid ligase II